MLLRTDWTLRLNLGLPQGIRGVEWWSMMYQSSLPVPGWWTIQLCPLNDRTVLWGEFGGQEIVEGWTEERDGTDQKRDGESHPPNISRQALGE